MKLKRMITLLGLLALLSGCTALDWLATLELANTDNIYINEGNIEGVIFAPDSTYVPDVESITTQLLKTTFEGYWLPTKADALALEAALPAYLRQQAAAGRDAEGVADRLSEYKRQYVGFIAGTEKMIYANYFCAAFDEDRWKRDFVFVMDGGNCFFQVIYQVSDGQFRHLSINGYA